MKKHILLISLLNVAANLICFGAGADFLYTFHNHSRLGWMQILAVAIIAYTQALVVYRREKLVQIQNKLINSATWRVINEQQGTKVPHST